MKFKKSFLTDANDELGPATFYGMMFEDFSLGYWHNLQANPTYFEIIWGKLRGSSKKGCHSIRIWNFACIFWIKDKRYKEDLLLEKK